jgi:hypothetical protein
MRGKMLFLNKTVALIVTIPYINDITEEDNYGMDKR